MQKKKVLICLIFTSRFAQKENPFSKNFIGFSREQTLWKYSFFLWMKTREVCLINLTFFFLPLTVFAFTFERWLWNGNLCKMWRVRMLFMCGNSLNLHQKENRSSYISYLVNLCITITAQFNKIKKKAKECRRGKKKSVSCTNMQ